MLNMRFRPGIIPRPCQLDSQSAPVCGAENAIIGYNQAGLDCKPGELVISRRLPPYMAVTGKETTAIVTIKEKYLHAPLKIQKILQDRKMIEVHIGCSNSHVYKVFNGDHSLYLKTQVVSEPFLFVHEVQILQWLHDKLPVPEVIEYTRDSKHEYLILSEIAGKNCVEAMETLDYKQIVFLLATGLRSIHSLDILTCPFDERIEEKLKKARYNVDNKLVDEENIDEERCGIMTSREILQSLQNDYPLEDDLVFTHGDYCLPNVLIQHDRINGFVDLDRAGVSDRYNDLAIASRSIRGNLGVHYEQLFFEYYGIDRVDEGKIAYYRLMDELS